MNILLLASHAVAEYDDVRMFSDLGYDVFAPGGYETPGKSGEGIRPALPDAPAHPELVELLHKTREAHRSPPGPMIDWAKARLHGDLIDWADVIIVHHFVEHWIAGQWDRIKHKRVIWRTCGQSNPGLEAYLAPLARPQPAVAGVRQGRQLEIVRYSPKEQPHFERMGQFAGVNAVIRFGKYPDDYGPWKGDIEAVGNLTQDLKERGESCGYLFWDAATRGLPTAPAGKGSEVLPNGLGLLTYDQMLDYLRRIRVYLYTGTQPASYTLGLIEAMMSGAPVVSIGPKAWGEDWGGSDLFEGHEIAQWPTGIPWSDEPANVAQMLRTVLSDDEVAYGASQAQRQRAINLFGIDKIGAQWREFLG